MKTTYYHLIKILSCSLAIAALLCCMIVPAMAETDVYQPKDYIYRTQFDGYTEEVLYVFDTVPYFSVKDQNSGSSFGEYGNISLSDDYGLNNSKPYIFRIYPLGNMFTPGQDCTSGLIDISDFKSKAVFNFSTFVTFDVQYAYKTYSAGTTEFYFNSYVYICLFDKDMKCVYYTLSTDIRTDVKLISAFPDGTGEHVVLELNTDLQIPDNAVYMAPCILTYFYPPAKNTDHNITHLQGSCHDFRFTVSKNMLVEQSETLKAVQDELGDLNDKADEMISGSDDMQNAADDFSGTAGDAAQDMNDALDQLEELPEANPDDVDLTFDGLLNDKGFKKYGNFFMMLSVDTLWTKVMIIVCTFIWLSTLLFGKRG